MRIVFLMLSCLMVCQCKTADKSMLASQELSRDKLKIYTDKTSQQLMPSSDPKTWCMDSPTELPFDNTLRFDISWPQAFSLHWVTWSNLDETRGQKQMYQQWGLKEIRQKEVNPNAIERVGTGTKYSLVEKDGVLYLTFRHSDSVKDWLDDINFVARKNPKASFSLSDMNPNVKVHAGFYNALEPLWADIIDTMKKRDPEHKTPIFVAGHSLSAAVAILAGAGLAREGFSVTGVYASGTPRVADDLWNELAGNLPIKNGETSYLLKDVIFDVVNYLDIIPRVPISANDAIYAKDIGTAFLPELFHDNIIVQKMGRKVYEAFIHSLERISSSPLIDYKSLGKRYSLGKDGLDVGAGISDTEYWQALRNDIVSAKKIDEKAKKLWSRLDYHYVRFPTGYACRMFNQLRSMSESPSS